jgi:DNA (cytosine-5)-methyltransferase 1
MKKYRCLDLFCGGGGAAMGYHRAGFEVVGVDNKPQPKYPFKFIQADALSYAIAAANDFDFIHASPPCQAYSNITPDKSKHKGLIALTRKVLQFVGKPYVIENVPGAKKELDSPIMLCGRQFNLKVYRHRFFECRPQILLVPHHVPHKDKTPSAGHGISPKGFLSITSGGQGITDEQVSRFLSPKGFISVAGHFSQVAYAKKAMGIDWLGQKELSQAIPPAYTQWLGEHFMKHLGSKLSTLDIVAVS